MLFQLFPTLIAAVVCLRRIERFLLAEPRVDRRPVIANETGELYQRRQECMPNGRFIDMPITEPGILSGETPTDQSGAAIIVRHGVFGWTKEKGILQGINVTIPRASLTLVIGRIRSSKSTLCKAFLSEDLQSNGNLDINGRSKDIAFCDQTPLLINDSIRDNTIGSCAYDRTWYTTVLDAVALGDDISMLPRRDETPVGTDGIVLRREGLGEL